MPGNPTYWGRGTTKLPFLRNIVWDGSEAALAEVSELLLLYGEITHDGQYIYNRSHGVKNLFYIILSLRLAKLIPEDTLNATLASAIATRSSSKKRPTSTSADSWKSYRNRLFGAGKSQSPYPNVKKLMVDLLTKYKCLPTELSR